jgi:UDP-glucuronate 4-epimerase
MTILLTGAAGFIGLHVAQLLLDRGERVIGIDSLNSYYDPALKDARLELLRGRNGFSFHHLDFADRDAMAALDKSHPEIDRIVHLGAQAGVRYSIEDPYAYVQSNILGHLVMMEFARGRMESGTFRHFVYASSSSVYGANTDIPFSVEDKADRPMSFYGATKKSNEVMSYSYASLFGIPSTGLRFFTVYGPWGRPDMSPWLFTERILRGEPIQVFNHGQMRRDFTYIDDIADGVIRALDHPAVGSDGAAPNALYNLGNNRPVALLDYIRVIEAACGVPAKLDMKPMQPGDVLETYSDIDTSTRDLGYRPSTPIEVGIPRFVDWFKTYHGL